MGCRSGGPPTPHNEMQGRRQADGAMISRALRGKGPLLFYSQGKSATRISKPTRQSRHPSCAPVLPLSCALCLRPYYHHSEAEPRETGEKGSGPGPSPHSARARRPNRIEWLLRRMRWPQRCQVTRLPVTRCSWLHEAVSRTVWDVRLRLGSTALMIP